MKQNIYDDLKFFTNYVDLRKSTGNLNDLIEIPAFRAMTGELNQKKVLDLGCGYGENCLWCIKRGAAKVTGVDISANMISKAKNDNNNERIEYYVSSIEDFHFQRERYDVVISSLALHYIKEFTLTIKKIYDALELKGRFVFSQEHPIITAYKGNSGWEKDSAGKKKHWIVDSYMEEGERDMYWFVDGVRKYHRTFETVVNTLIKTGFRIEKVAEPVPIPGAKKYSAQIEDEYRRPAFLIISCIKE